MWTIIESGYGGDPHERDEEGDQRAIVRNWITGERLEFRHRDALEDARLHCHYGNESPDERRERQQPFGSDWHAEQRERMGEVPF